MENSIFISYAHENAEAVGLIAENIKRVSGMTVWLDSELRGGDNFIEVIANTIFSSSYFVFIVSEASVFSKWCLKELEFAFNEGKRIVAVWLEEAVGIPKGVSMLIQDTHYIRYTANEVFLEELAKAFCADTARRRGGSDETEADAASVWQDACFLDDGQLRRISRLLTYETQKRYAVCFRAENACLLGLAYELGVRVRKDTKKAEFYYKISAHRGSYDGKYLYAALRGRLREDDGGSEEQILDAARHGSVFALTRLGNSYYFGGNGCEKDRKKAYELWKEAADSGGAAAMYYLAYGYHRGDCLEKDADLAYMYALLAAEAGFPRAFRLLAFIHARGDGVETDYRKAISLYEEAVKRGDYLSLCYEGWVYGVLGDDERCRELYEEAVARAEAGELESGLPFYRMGCLYESGRGVEKDCGKAAEYFLAGAERNDPHARYRAVSAIRRLADAEQREKYLKRALKAGCRNAAYELGKIEKARGAGRRLSERAVEYFAAGAESGDIFCVIPLIANYSCVQGQGSGERDREEALYWYRFLFARADERSMKLFRKNGELATLYYTYACNLDGPSDGRKERELVRMYLKKSLEESPRYLYDIVARFALGRLFPEGAARKEADVADAEKLLELAEDSLPAYRGYLGSGKVTEPARRWTALTEKIARGLETLSECYRQGLQTAVNEAKAERYSRKAAETAALRFEEEQPPQA